jgi:MFS family permease
VIPLHAIVLRRHPRDLGLQPDGDNLSVEEVKTKRDESVSLNDAVRQASFWWFTAAFAFAMLSSVAIRVHLIPLLLDRGFDATFAASLTGIIGAMQVLGRVLYAPTESKIPKRLMIAGIFTLQAIALLILIFVQTTAGVWVFVVILGAANGAMTLARPALLADFYGTAFYGRISSVMVVFLTGAVTLAPVGAGWLYTIQGNYDMVLWILVGLSLFSVLAITFVRKNA